MKLLFDHNLSPRLVDHLVDIYPDASHVSLVDLESASDVQVWTYARTNDYIIVTKDSDFNDLSVLYGFPPKILWLRLGNCTTRQIGGLLRTNLQVITDFSNAPDVGVLLLS